MCLMLAPSHICIKPKLAFSSEAGKMRSFNVKKTRVGAWAQNVFRNPCRTSLPAVIKHYNLELSLSKTNTNCLRFHLHSTLQRAPPTRSRHPKGPCLRPLLPGALRQVGGHSSTPGTLHCDI